MNAYYFNVSNEDREDIRAKHKSLYDGYVTLNKTSNTQPLTVEDMAGDKNGITLNNKGVVTTYKNFGINESEQEAALDVNDKFDYTEEIEEDVEEVCETCVEEELTNEIQDEDLVESFKEERKLVLDMFNRFKNFN
jgi:hypothetical protein